MEPRDFTKSENWFPRGECSFRVCFIQLFDVLPLEKRESIISGQKSYPHARTGTIFLGRGEEPIFSRVFSPVFILPPEVVDGREACPLLSADVPYYFFLSLKGICLFVVILLIGTGTAIVQPRKKETSTLQRLSNDNVSPRFFQT